MKTARIVVAGALSGLGVVILLQQYAVAYPTGLLAVLGVVLGIGVQFGVSWLSRRPHRALAPAEPTGILEWSPTHRVPESGLDAFDECDAALPPVARLDPGLGVLVGETHGDWARITCENGWSAWVDGRWLEVVHEHA